MTEADSLRLEIRALKTEVIRLAANYTHFYEQAAPEEGMGLPYSIHVSDALERYGYSKDEVDMDSLLSQGNG